MDMNQSIIKSIIAQGAVCDICGILLTEANCIIVKGKQYCKQCYNKEYAEAQLTFDFDSKE